MVSIFERVAVQVAQKQLQRIKIPNKISKHFSTAQALASGDITGAINAAFIAHYADDNVPGGTAPVPNKPAPAPSPLVGGITLKKAQEIFKQVAGTEYAKKNLWRLDIFSLGNSPEVDCNFFATDVSYAPITLSGEAVRVGSGSFDTVQNLERVEMRVTTLDDSGGYLKGWFRALSQQVAHGDGTFGVPLDYLFKVVVTHAYVSDEAEGAINAYTQSYIMRPGSMEHDLSRRDDALEEIQFTFVQFDTFTNLR